MHKYLITGGSGFIGSHLCKKLIDLGNEVVVIDNLSTGSIENLDNLMSKPKFKFIKETILNEKVLEDLVKNCDRVFHLAAAVGVKLIIEKPLQSLYTNLHGTENILRLCSKYDKRVLITSTSEVYGKNTSEALNENDDRILGSTIKTRWSYSEAKAIDEILAYLYWIENKLETITVRLFNTVGPKQIGSYGMVIPSFINNALKNRDIEIYGDGTQKRCFCHVTDVIEALVKLMDHDKAVGEIFNIGSTEEITIKELADKIILKLNSASRIKFLDYSEAYSEGFEDMMRRKPSIAKIEKFIGWKPKFNLENIIIDVANHCKI